MSSRVKTLGFTDLEVIATNIRKLMESNQVSESQLAKALGVSVMTIRRVVSGETEDPRISTISLIADYFEVGLDSLLEVRDIPINFTQKNKPFFVPILDWEILENNHIYENLDLGKWQKWYPLVSSESLNLDKKTFAIEGKPSMQPRFPIGTLFIVNPQESLIDNDIILIKSKESGSLSLRELIIDTPKWILQPIIIGSELIYFDKNKYDIVGVVVLTVFHARN